MAAGLFSQLRKVSWTLWLPSALCCAGAYISCNLALDLTAATKRRIHHVPAGFVRSSSVFPGVPRPYAWRHLPVQLVTIVGLFLLCCNTGSFSFGPGEALALLDALCLAGVLVFGEKAIAQMDVLSVTGVQIGVTMILSLAGALIFDHTSVLAPQNRKPGW